MSNFGFRFADSFGNQYGEQTQTKEFQGQKDEALKRMLIGAEAMDFVSKKHGINDPSELISILASFILSFYINAAVDVKDQRAVSNKLQETEKKASGVIETMLKFSKDGPEEALATLALAYNGLFTTTQEMKQQASPKDEIVSEFERLMRQRFNK